MEVASVVGSGMELDTLGVYLRRDPNAVRRLQNGCQDVRHTAYQILCSFYNCIENSERWGILINALIKIDQRIKVKELGLDELHKKAQSEAKS